MTSYSNHTHRSASASKSLPKEQRKAIGAGVAGYILEWFDFGVYGFLAPIIARNFFPATDELTGLLASFAVFGVGFLSRPVGSFVLGRMADKKGRSFTLAVTMILMAISTVAIGMLPTYDTIGLLAPILLVIARLVQGFAAGGEWGTAAAFLVEWGGERRRGFFGAFQQSSIAAGLLLGSLTAAILSTLMSTTSLSEWGWRIPFLLGALLGPIGMYVRRSVHDAPTFEKPAAAAPQIAARAFVASVFKAFMFLVFWSVSSYMVAVYMATFASRYAHITSTQALWTSTLSLVIVMLVAPLMGALSDRVGRKPVLLVSCSFFALLSYPLYLFIVSGSSFGAFVLVQLVMSVMFSMYSGVGPAALAEMFSTHVRSTGVSVGAGLAAFLGGYAPFFTTWVIALTGVSAHAGWILAGSALITLPVLIAMRETAHDRII